MSNLEFPEGYISKYRSGEKVFKYSDMFIDTYILFIIDYFYINNVNISETLIMENINTKFQTNFTSISDIHETIQKCTPEPININVYIHLYHKSFLNYLSKEDPLNIVVHMMKTINISNLIEKVKKCEYFSFFETLLTYRSGYFHRLYVKFLTDFAKNDEYYKPRLFACILSDVFIRPESYPDFPKDILEKYKVDPEELNDYINDNDNYHKLPSEFQTDLIVELLENNPISDYSLLIDRYINIYLSEECNLDIELMSLIMYSDPEECYKRLSKDDIFYIYIVDSLILMDHVYMLYGI